MIRKVQNLLDHVVVLERAGEWSTALEICERAFSSSVQNGDVGTLLESVLRLGYAHRGAGQVELAVEQLELAELLGRLHGMPEVASRALNGLGVVEYEHGRSVRAQECYLAARALAAAAGDQHTLGMIEQNLGLLSFVRGDLPRALEHYQSGLAAYEELGDERGIARVANNMAMLYIDLGEISNATSSLERALKISREEKDASTEGIVHTNFAELWLTLGELDRARASCDRAFEIASRLDDKLVRADALKLYGIIYRESSRPYLAEIHLRESIQNAAACNFPLTEAEGHRELALVLRAQDRNREALEALNRAQTLFSELHARQKQADIDKRLDQLEQDFLSIVHAWGESIEAKDRYTAGHCQRVADYACRIAERAGLSKRDLTWFRMGAFLHDVGKTETPAEILNKPGQLSAEELDVMQQHTIAGDELLSSINFPYDVRAMVRSHHERWSGGGYPDGLSGEAIPHTARILRIADVFDALTTNRSYRQPMPPERAFEIMREEADTYDPELFAIFAELFPVFAEEVRQLHAERWSSLLPDEAEQEESADAPCDPGAPSPEAPPV